MENRKIIHIDMDAFFAAIEQRDCPKYQGMPVIVGGDPDKRGVVAACSYEARAFGIHSAMSSARARQLCPDAMFLRPRFEVYRRTSNTIQSIFRQLTDLVEPSSLDEAYLDVSDCAAYQGSATLIARAIKQAIKQQTGLTASAGISYNKFLAKIASDMDKPDGLYLITPEQGESFIAHLPIRKFFGIGKATEARMKKLDIHTGADLKKWTREQLVTRFGKAGHYYHDIARGKDHRPVQNSRVRKSLGSEQTFDRDLDNVDQMLVQLEKLAIKVSAGLQEKQLVARTITLKIKYDDFEQITRSGTREETFNEQSKIFHVVPKLLSKTEAGKRRVRLLGITASKLSPINKEIDDAQLTLFPL